MEITEIILAKDSIYLVENSKLNEDIDQDDKEFIIKEETDNISI
jgi:hypothetical protein